MLDKDILLLIHVIILWKIVSVIVQFERNFQFKLYNTKELIFRIFCNKFISSSNCLFIFTCSVKLSLLIFLLIARLDNISFSSEKKEFRFMWKRISDK